MKNKQVFTSVTCNIFRAYSPFCQTMESMGYPATGQATYRGSPATADTLGIGRMYGSPETEQLFK